MAGSKVLAISRRAFLGRTALIASASLLAACGSAPTAAVPSAAPGATRSASGSAAAPAVNSTTQSTGTASIVIAQEADAVTMDAMMTHTVTTFVILQNLYDSLVGWGSDGKIAPFLAESWKQVDDKTVDFKLRSGVKFHNGEELTAEAVKYSFDRVLLPDIVSPATFYFKRAGIQAQIVDPATVRVTTAVPYSALLPTLTQAYIVPPKYLAQVGKEGFNQKPVGTGAYKFVEWVKDQRVVMERNDSYWGGAPTIQRVTFRPIPEAAARLAALTTGEADLVTSVSPDRYTDIEQGKDTKLVTRQGTTLYLGMQQLRPPFNDKRVRQAMNYAVDVDAIIKGLMKDQVTRLPSAFRREVPGYDSQMKPYAYDPAKAKQLLADAGHLNGFETELYYSPNQPGITKLKEVAEAITEQLKKVGISTKLNPLEAAAFSQRWPSGDFPMYLGAFDPSGAGQYLELLFSSKTRGWYYRDPTADQLIDQYFATLDPAQQVAVGQKLNQFLYDEAPWLFLFQYKNAYGTRKNITWDAKPDFDAYIRVSAIKKG